AFDERDREYLCGGRDGAVRLLGPRAVFPLQPGSPRRLYQSHRAADGNRAADWSEPDADRFRWLDDLYAASGASRVSDSHLRRDAQGALLFQKCNWALDARMRADLAVPHRSRPDGRHDRE